MNRNEEFEALLRELDKTPPELEYTVTRAKARVNSRRRIRRWAGIPVGTLAGAFLAFVVLVNTNVAFAQACSNLPILGDLAAAVDWSGSLSAAVENDYVQAVGQSQTRDGVTVTVDYVIVDQQQLNLFVTTENEDEDYPYALLRWDILSAAGEYSVTTYGEHENGQLRRITIDFGEQSSVPEELTMAFTVRPFRELNDYDAALDQESVGDFTFTIQFDPSYTASGEIVSIGQWVELDGQRIYVDSLEIYPTHARLKLADGEANTLRLKDLYFYLEDELGTRYENEGGIGGYNDPVTGFAFDRRVGSPWFSEGDHLTLYITGAAWVDENARQVTVDLAGETAEGLPDGVVFEGVSHWDGRDVLNFRTPYLPSGGTFFLFDYEYADPEGETHRATSGGATTDETDTFLNMFYLTDYPYDSVALTLNCTSWHSFDEPIAIIIK